MASCCNFNKVWGVNHSGCANVLFDLTGRMRATGTILVGLPSTIRTCSEAMSAFSKRLQKRLSASDVVVMSNSNNQFDIELRIGRDDATATLKPANNCNFPINTTYAKGPDSGEANFQDLNQALTWLTIRLRR